jgi:bifunctional non-homologous end joining protein LigD
MAKPPKRPREIKRAADASGTSLSSRALTRRKLAGQAELWAEPIGDLAPMPALVAPCLPTLVNKPPAGERWQHEIKWDGYRLMAYREGSSVRLLTRNGHDWTERFPAIAAAVASLPVASIILDGEAVVLDQNGVSGFGAISRDRCAEPGDLNRQRAE